MNSNSLIELVDIRLRNHRQQAKQGKASLSIADAEIMQSLRNELQEHLDRMRMTDPGDVAEELPASPRELKDIRSLCQLVAEAGLRRGLGRERGRPEDVSRQIVQTALEQFAPTTRHSNLQEAIDAALRRYLAVASRVGGCSDGGCVIQKPTGMHTNGSCHCADDRQKSRLMLSAAATLVENIQKALKANLRGQAGLP